jgi:hypothetical protein
MFLLIGYLIAVPFVLVSEVFRMRQRWRMVSLEIKSHIRLRTSTFVLVLLIGASAYGVIPYNNSIEVYCALGVGGFSLLNLGAGLFGVFFANRCRFDPMAIFWWGVGAASCAALLFIREWQDGD